MRGWTPGRSSRRRRPRSRPMRTSGRSGAGWRGVAPRSQDHAAATFAPKVLPDERTIDWSQPADAIVRRVRAFAPDPGAVCTFRGGRLKVLRAATRPIGADTL